VGEPEAQPGKTSRYACYDLRLRLASICGVARLERRSCVLKYLPGTDDLGKSEGATGWPIQGNFGSA
jgi:hypothetical protein